MKLRHLFLSGIPGFALMSLNLVTLPGHTATTSAPHDTQRLKVDAVRNEVDSIRNIDSISNWRTLDTQRLTLRINKAQNYLLTLSQPCAQLSGARLVGVSMTNREIWADFDYIAADGWECRIDTIERLERRRS